MEITEAIQIRIETIGREVMALVENRQISLTEKNRMMKPLVEEKQLLERTLRELHIIRTTDYSGRCGG